MRDENTGFNILSGDEKIKLRKSVFLAIWWQVMLSMLIAAAFVIAKHQGFIFKKLDYDIFTPIIITGLFSFRFYIAYCRFSESYKLWYAIIDASRIICRNIWIMIPINNTQELNIKKDYLRLVGILTIAIKLNLQNESIDVDQDMRTFLSEELYSELREVNNVPIRVVNLLTEYFYRIFHTNQTIDRELFIELNHSLNRLTMIFSDCQRISNTCISGYFSIYCKYFIIFFHLVILPWHLAEDLHGFTIPIVGIASYISLGLQDIIVKIENPFRSKYNKAYLDKTCQNLQAQIVLEWIDYNPCQPKFSDL